MANPRQIHKFPITWTNVGGTDYSQPIKTADFRNIGLTISGTGSVSVLGTKERYQGNDVPVDFTSPASISNSYAAIVIADETAANTYATSLSVAGATKLGEVNTNLMTFICLTRSANTVDAFITLTDNQ